MRDGLGRGTKAVHAGEDHRTAPYGEVVVPIYLSSTYARSKVGERRGMYEYSRAGNPTRTALEERLAALENGSGAVALSSGMAAESMALLLLKPGARVAVSSDLYGGTYRLCERVLSRFGMGFIYVDLRELENLLSPLSQGLDMIWIETPTNPLLRITDIKEVSTLAHAHNPNTKVVVDNTFASPYFQKPLDLGSDIVVHSTTKYLAGHSDVLGGAVIANDEGILRDLRLLQRSVGAIIGPFDSFLTLRGIRTLHLRMERHQENAMAVAKFLEGHKLVDNVYYPGLPSHPQHRLAQQQMSGFSGMLSFETVPGVNSAKVAESTELFALAESLGGVESLIECPAFMTHASIPREVRLRSGVTDSLIRLSVGIEDVEDLIADLEQALEGAVA